MHCICILATYSISHALRHLPGEEKDEAGQTKAGGEEGDQQEGQQDDQAEPAEEEQEGNAGGDEEGQRALGTGEFPVQQGAGGTLWRLMWVEVGKDLLPTKPIRVKATLDDPAPPATDAKQGILTKSTATASAPAPPASQSSGVADVARNQGGSTTAVVAASGSADAIVAGAADSNDQPAPSVGQILQQMHGMLTIMADPEKQSKWLHELPSIEVKDAYLSHQGPPAKGHVEEGQEKQRGRGCWPSAFKGDIVDKGLEDFRLWLVHQQSKKEDNAVTIVMHVGRALGALKLTGTAPGPHKGLTDVKTLVALYTSNEYLKFVNMELMSPIYGWTIKTIDALASYCRFHLYELTQKSIRSEVGPWDEYSNVLHAFVKDLKGGFRKRCEDQRSKNIHQKKAEDLQRMKNLPSIKVLQEAVHASYMVLQAIAMKWAGKPSMPASVRALANACLCGGINLDTFMGRSMEWELLKFSHAKGQLDENLDFIICTGHKTIKTYGDLAKWLSPGLAEAVKCYMKLPRPHCNGNLILPARIGNDRIHFASCLHTFCSKFLPGDKTHPTVNLVRKWVHTSLMRMTDTKDKMKSIMGLLDAHSKAVQDRHYWLTEPEEDVVLARLLVQAVFGATVDWPSQEQVVASLKKQGIFTPAIKNMINECGDSLDEEPHDEAQEAEDEEEFECLEWWEAAGDFFGIPKPGLSALGDSEPSEAFPQQQLQLVPVAATEALGQEGGKAKKDGKKAKRQGKEAKSKRQDKGAKAKKVGKKAKDKAHRKVAMRLAPIAFGNERKAAEAKQDEPQAAAKRQPKQEELQAAANNEADDAGATAVVAQVASGARLSQEVTHWLMTQYTKQLEKQGLPKDDLPGQDFFKHLRFVARHTGRVLASVSADMVKDIVVTEMAKPAGPPPPPAAVYEGKARRKISKELDAFIVNYYLAAVEEHGPEGCEAARSYLSTSTITSCLSTCTSSLGNSFGNSLSNSFGDSLGNSHCSSLATT